MDRKGRRVRRTKVNFSFLLWSPFFFFCDRLIVNLRKSSRPKSKKRGTETPTQKFYIYFLENLCVTNLKNKVVPSKGNRRRWERIWNRFMRNEDLKIEDDEYFDTEWIIHFQY